MLTLFCNFSTRSRHDYTIDTLDVLKTCDACAAMCQL